MKNTFRGIVMGLSIAISGGCSYHETSGRDTIISNAREQSSYETSPPKMRVLVPGAIDQKAILNPSKIDENMIIKPKYDLNSQSKDNR